MNPKTSQLPARSVLIAFCAIVAIGGTNFVVIKLSNAELPPLYGAGLRFGAAALIFLAIMRIRKMSLPRGRALAGAAVYGTLSFGMVYGLIYFALLGIGAGTTSLIMAAVPLATLVIAVLQRQEQFTLRGVTGGLLAMSGIAVLSYRAMGNAVSPLPLLAALAAMLAASQGAVLVKSFPKSDPITTNAVGMSVGGTGLLAASAVFGEPWAIPGLLRTWAALAWLIVVGSVGLFSLFVFVIKRWKASATAYALTLMPVVAVALGALLIGEQIGGETVAGGALVLLGVYVGALSGSRRHAHSQPLAPSIAREEAPA